MDGPMIDVAQEVASRTWGKYRGIVVHNDDPKRLGRLRLRVPGVLGEELSHWALPCLPYGGLTDQGTFLIPDPGARVWVEFEAGDVSKPIWTGTFWAAEGDPPTEADRTPPNNRVVKTAAGHVLELDDEEDAERVRLAHASGAELAIDPNGSVLLTDAEGAMVSLDAEGSELTVEDANGNRMVMTSSGVTVEDANGNKIAMAAAGITIDAPKVTVKGSRVELAGAGGEPLLKGQTFLTLFMSHVHPTSVGPSGPPVPTGTEMNALSSKTTTG